MRIGVSPITPPHIVDDLWEQLQKEVPDVRLRFVPFENTKENAKEILAHLGENIDIVCGIFDEMLLEKYVCDGLEICKKAIGIAVSVHHRLAKKEKLSIEDLYGEDLMVMQFPDESVDAVSSAGINMEGSNPSGNAELLARMAQETTDGDRFFIETTGKYPAEYRATTDQAKDEQNEDARAEIVFHVENMNAYDTVVLIYPNRLAYHNLIQCTQA